MIDKAFLDTNSLYGELSTVMLLDLAEQWLYFPYWSDYVEKELRNHLTGRLGDNALERRLRNMNEAFPQSRILEWSQYTEIASDFVTDPDDAAILAGAIACKADYLVTNNTSDFKQNRILPLFGVQILTLGDFLSTLMEQYPKETWNTLLDMVKRNRKPPRTMRDLQSKLFTMPETASFAAMLDRHAGRRYQNQRNLVNHGTQGRDRLGRFTSIPQDDSDLYDVWGAHGNGY